MFKRTKISQAAGLALSGVMTVAIAPALAQDATPQRIEITGSAIKRVQAEGALPVQIVSKEEIKRAGVTSVTELIQRLPAMAGATGEAAGVGGGGAVSRELRSTTSARRARSSCSTVVDWRSSVVRR